MVQAMGELRGRVMLRPWRVGLLVDTKSAAEVRAAIADMSSVWGGYHMPIRYGTASRPDSAVR